MDNDTQDESNSTGSSSVLRVAPHCSKCPRVLFSGKRDRESQNNPVKKKPHACATVQLCHVTREVVGTGF